MASRAPLLSLLDLPSDTFEALPETLTPEEKQATFTRISDSDLLSTGSGPGSFPDKR